MQQSMQRLSPTGLCAGEPGGAAPGSLWLQSAKPANAAPGASAIADRLMSNANMQPCRASA